jgi:uncharacterized protein (DUF433 family)
MNKIEIEEKLDRSWVLELLSSGYTTYDIATNYELTEDTILECTDLLDKDVLVRGLNFSEEFVTKAIEVEYLSIEDITELSMSTYSNLSDEFITKYKENINWNRMILYISTQSDSFDKHTKVIEDKNLWSVISANDLSIDFIRQWKDKLDWSYLSMVKCFTDDEKLEFVDYIVNPVQKEISEEFIITDYLNFSNKISDEELENLIEEISKHVGKY